MSSDVMRTWRLQSSTGDSMPHFGPEGPGCPSSLWRLLPGQPLSTLDCLWGVK